MPLLLEMFDVGKERWKSDFTTFTTMDSCWTWIDAAVGLVPWNQGLVLVWLDHLYPLLKFAERGKGFSMLSKRTRLLTTRGPTG